MRSFNTDYRDISLPSILFLLIKPISRRRARRKERETSLLYSYILGIMDRDLEGEAWDKAGLSLSLSLSLLVDGILNSRWKDRSYICEKWGWNVRSGNTRSRFNKLLKGLLHARHTKLWTVEGHAWGGRIELIPPKEGASRSYGCSLSRVIVIALVVMQRGGRLAVTREGHSTRRKGLRRRRIRKRGDKEADDIHRLPTFHSSLVVPFHAKITGLLPHEYV